MEEEALSRGTSGYYDLANEMQLINLDRMQDMTKSLQASGSSAVYIITDVSSVNITNNQIVNVSFYSSNPQSSDWIAAYSPVLNTNELNSTVPVKYGYCDELDSYLETGYGMLQFNFTNLRDDIAFYYMIDGTYYPSIVNSSLSTFIVKFQNPNQPLRPRVVATGDPDTFNLLWSSATSTLPQMQWGVSSGAYDRFVPAITTHINQSSMCGFPANTTGWRDMGLIHTATMTGMKALADSKIYYRFGDNATNDYSEEFVFLAPPLAGQNPVIGTRVILYDDLGRGSTDDTYTWNHYGRPSIYVTMAVGAEVLANTVHAVYHGGDISYATGYEAVWDFWLNQISPVASGTLYLTTVGNHETDWPGTASYYNGTDSGGECGITTTTLMPLPAPAVTNAPWWSYDVGLIHFVGMSTEHDYTIDSAQYLWLENDLKNVNRTLTPWVIFGGHRPMYINSDYGGTRSSDIYVMDMMIENIEPLLWKYQVNLGFYGHNHVMQRHSAVLNKVVIQASKPVVGSDGSTIHWHADPQATVHMVIGAAGAGFTKNAIPEGEPGHPEWNEMYVYYYGYARVTAVNASYLDWEWVNVYTGEVYDHMVITQNETALGQGWTLSNDNNDENSKNSFWTTDLGIGAIVGAGVGLLLLLLVGCVVMIPSIRQTGPCKYVLSPKGEAFLGGNEKSDANGVEEGENGGGRE